MATIKASYTECILSPEGLRRSIRRAVGALRPISGQFDCIAYRGNSGGAVAPAVAAVMNKHLLMVRKNDGAHSSMGVEGPIGLDRYVIVDDFICSGATIREIRKKVAAHNKQAVCVGVVLYNTDEHLWRSIEYLATKEADDLRLLPWEPYGDRVRKLAGYCRLQEVEREATAEGWLRYVFGPAVSDPTAWCGGLATPVVEVMFSPEELARLPGDHLWGHIAELVRKAKKRWVAESPETVPSDDAWSELIRSAVTNYKKPHMALPFIYAKIERGEYEGVEALSKEQFRVDVLRAYGLAETKEGERAFELAWEWGHSCGLNDVTLMFEELADLIEIAMG